MYYFVKNCSPLREPSSSNNSELLAILLGSGIKGTNVKVLAQKILKKFGDNFLNVTIDNLKQIDGIGPAKALQIVSVLASFLGRKLSTDVFLIPGKHQIA